MLATSLAPSFAQSGVCDAVKGTWLIERYELVITKKLSKQIRAKVKRYEPSVMRDNIKIAEGIMVLSVEFNSDSTYNYKRMEDGRVYSFEHGVWGCSGDILVAKNLTLDERSTFDGERTVTVTQERRMAEYTLFGKNSGVLQRIIYKRKT